MKTTTYLSILSLMTIGVFYSAAPARAQSILGLAENFVVLGATSVINTGATTLLGDLGVSPGFSITGMGSIPPTETLHQSDTAAQKAQVDANTAYDMLAGKPYTTDLTGQDLGGRTLTPGVYFFSSSAELTGTLTLDTLNNPNALFVFQIGGSLITASNSVVKMSNGAANDSVFWQVGSSATLGSSTLFWEIFLRIRILPLIQPRRFWAVEPLR